MSNQAQYTPGEIVNGQVMGNDGQWHQGGAVPAPPKKKRRVFLWFFLAVQALFIIWLVTGVSGASGPASDCGSLSQQACNDAEAVGTGIGAMLIVVFWCVVDFLLAVTYGIYRLAKRS